MISLKYILNLVLLNRVQATHIYISDAGSAEDALSMFAANVNGSESVKKNFHFINSSSRSYYINIILYNRN